MKYIRIAAWIVITVNAIAIVGSIVALVFIGKAVNWYWAMDKAVIISWAGMFLFHDRIRG